jgi:hypothetical protein
MCVAGLIALMSLSMAAVAWAKLTTQTASSGATSATFTFTGAAPTVKNPRLRIVHAGQQLYDAPVFSSLCGHGCGPGAFSGSSVRVADIESNGQPDVILSLFSGGANCCFIEQVFSLDSGTMTYVKTEQDFASAGAKLERIAGRWRFRSSDPSFECAFTDCADSGSPLQIWKFSAHKFVDATRGYKSRIRADAASWLRAFKHHLRNGVGLIAPWAADQELLGHNALVQSTLSAYAAKHELRAAIGDSTGPRFIRQLNRLLRKLGYEHS